MWAQGGGILCKRWSRPELSTRSGLGTTHASHQCSFHFAGGLMKKVFKSAINFVINVTQHTQNTVNSSCDQFQKLVMSSFTLVIVIVHSSLDSMCSRYQFGAATFHKHDGSCGWWLPCWTVQLFDALLGHGGPL